MASQSSGLAEARSRFVGHAQSFIHRCRNAIAALPVRDALIQTGQAVRGWLESIKGREVARTGRRPLGVTLIAIATFSTAAVLAIGAIAFFSVAVMALGGEDGSDPISAAIAGMGFAGGFSLLVLAGVAGCVAVGVLQLREWARIAAIGSTAVEIACTCLSIFAFAGHPLIPVVPMVVCDAVAIGAGIWMVAYLAQPRVKQKFRAATA